LSVNLPKIHFEGNVHNSKRLPVSTLKELEQVNNESEVNA